MTNSIAYILMIIVTICTYISYVPQIVKLVKTKKSEDISIGSWTLWVTSSVASLSYGLILQRIELILADISELVLELIVLILSLKYKKQQV